VKQTKISIGTRVKRPLPARAKTKARAQVRARRALHKRLLVHPFTAKVLLCAGVLIIGTAVRSFAASYNVTATVPAPLPTQAATISSPNASQHFVTNTAVVKGGCPAQSYVKLLRNGVSSGVAACSGNSYQIQTSLASGVNRLDAQVYSLTDSPGPTGIPLDVYYDDTTQTSPAAPAAVPTTLTVTNLDSNSYKQGITLHASDNPTVSGFAPPLSLMTVTFHSDPQTCITRANAVGWWTCTLDHTLSAGVHHVDVTALTTDGQTLVFPTFQIMVAAGLPSLLKPAPAPGSPQAAALALLADYHYAVHLGGQDVDLELGLSGGAQPYTVLTDWGDGTTTRLVRSDTSPFSVSHSYTASSGASRSYAVITRATDAQNHSALLQLAVTVKGDGALLTANTAGYSNVYGVVHHWFWLILPAYTIVVLMAIGYYLGEREEYRLLMARKKAKAAKVR
jgi:hypothetical protein